MEKELSPTIQNLVNQKSLKWIFVGGKGGVGKTTTSASIAVTIAKSRKKVIIISTDPAHNLGDSFQQSLSSVPTLLKGFDNLYAMEVESKIDPNSIELPDIMDSSDGTKAFWAQAISSMPGIDEVMVFTKVIKNIEEMEFDLVIFDTAPTGHTLKLLSFPKTMKMGLEKLLGMKEKFQGILQSFMMGQSFDTVFQDSFKKMEELRDLSEKFKSILTNPDLCTFVGVCIPEYLSVYETERMVQELTESDIDIRNIVVNQILIPEKGSNCNKCNSRFKMQKKYLNQIFELYFDFHVTLSTLQDTEVKGIKLLESYGERLLQKTELP